MYIKKIRNRRTKAVRLKKKQQKSRKKITGVRFSKT